jgi:carbon-monoxide dehydrogenase large subunit
MTDRGAPTPVAQAPAARWVGQSVRRREDARLTTGHGRYVDDVVPADCLHAAFVRSPVARGRLTGLDVTAALAVPGVVAVFTGADLNDPARESWMTLFGPSPVPLPEPRVLATEDVRYVGEPIALVVADSRYTAEDGAEMVEFDVDAQPAVVGMTSAAANPERVHPELASNVAMAIPAMPAPDLDEVFAGAARVVDETIEQHRYLCVPMEPRGIVAAWDPWNEWLEIHAATQGPHELRLFYSRYLGLPEDRIRVVMGDVGGAFGQKMFPMREEHATVLAAMKLGRPVKWIEDRAENLVSGGHAREENMRISLALDADGTILGARGHHVEDVGAYPYGGASAGANAPTAMPVFTGPYRIAKAAFTSEAVYTNTCGHVAYRGPWMMETTAREQVVDIAARELGIDPLELRRRNVIQKSDQPFTNAFGLVFDAVSPAETLEQAAELIGYDAFRAEQESARADGRLLGIGLSLYIEPSFGFGALGTEAATIRIEPSGKVNVFMSTGGHGQSVETTMAQVVADELGCSFDDVRVMQGDSASSPYGVGTGGSRTAAIAGGAARAASIPLREKVAAIAAHMLEASVEDLDVANSLVTVKGDPTTAVPFAQVAALAYMNTDGLPPGLVPGLEASVRYKAPMFMFSNACHACIVEVDRVTGQVQILKYLVSEDCGNMINPMVVEGQIAGGVVQGIGGVFYEHMIYDDDGNPLTTTFLDYLLPTAAEVPDLTYGHIVTPATDVPGGYKGMGEGGAIAAPAALANAVRDAVWHLGARVTAQPLSPDRVAAMLA